jgi:hypothetical protein
MNQFDSGEKWRKLLAREGARLECETRIKNCSAEYTTDPSVASMTGENVIHAFAKPGTGSQKDYKISVSFC